MQLKDIDKKEYNNIHKWIRKIYGSASSCEFCNIKNAPAYHWALKKGCDYKKDVACFMQLCAKCHINYDYTEERRQASIIFCKTKYNDPAARIKQRDCAPKAGIEQMNMEGIVIKAFKSMRDAERELNISSASISRCCRGLKRHASGFRFRYTSVGHENYYSIEQVNMILSVLNKDKNKTLKAVISETNIPSGIVNRIIWNNAFDIQSKITWKEEYYESKRNVWRRRIVFKLKSNQSKQQ